MVETGFCCQEVILLLRITKWVELPIWMAWCRFSPGELVGAWPFRVQPTICQSAAGAVWPWSPMPHTEAGLPVKFGNSSDRPSRTTPDLRTRAGLALKLEA